MFIYEKDPERIYQKSFEIIQKEIDIESYPKGIREVVIRIIHSCGMTDIIKDIHYSSNFLTSGLDALTTGKTIYCDSFMTANGIIRKNLPSYNEVKVTLKDIGAVQKNPAKTTRSAAAIDQWFPACNGSLAVIGNAPTALFRLLELAHTHKQKPALVIGVPVGFVGAQESKAELINSDLGIEYITITGRRGGSAIAASIINAMALLLKNQFS